MGYEIDFLPVGEGERSGDAIAFRFGDLLSGDRSKQTVVIVDGGFQPSGEALVKHVQQYYKTSDVDLVVSTHPDYDHAGGLEIALQELKVRCLWMHRPWNHTSDIAKMFVDGRVTDQSVSIGLRKALEDARTLENLAARKRIPIIEPFAGTVDESRHILVLAPTVDYYESLLPGFRSTPEQKGGPGIIYKAREVIRKIAETFGKETLDDIEQATPENNSSAILLVVVDDGYIILTSDACITALTHAMDYRDGRQIERSKMVFIQVPHHGSPHSVGPTVLNRLVGPKLAQDQPRLTAYVSVAKDAPTRPSRKVTNAFRRRGANVYATAGGAKWHHRQAPDRGWDKAVPIPFYDDVEE